MTWKGREPSIVGPAGTRTRWQAPTHTIYYTFPILMLVFLAVRPAPGTPPPGHCVLWQRYTDGHLTYTLPLPIRNQLIYEHFISVISLLHTVSYVFVFICSCSSLHRIRNKSSPLGSLVMWLLVIQKLVWREEETSRQYTLRREE